MLIFLPSDLAGLGADRLHSVSGHEESYRLLGQIWSAVKASGAAENFSERPDPSVYTCRGRGTVQLAGAVTADSAESSEFGGFLSSGAAELGLTADECGFMGSRAKLRRVAEKRMPRGTNQPVCPGRSSA